MEIIELPKTPFSIKKLQFLEDNGQLKDNLDVFNYVMDYYYETKNGMYFFYDAISDFKKEVIYKLKNEKLYKRFKMNSKIFKIVSIIGKPRIYKEGEDRYYINQSGSFLYQNYKHYDEYSPEIKEKVEMIFDMMKVVSCSNDEVLFKAYITWYAQIARGMKTECIPTRISSIQGLGKSFEPRFL